MNQALRDDARLNEMVIGVDLALDRVTAVKGFAMKVSQIFTFLDDPFDPIGSPEGDLYSEVHEALWSLLETLHVDAKKRQIIWPDGQRLNFDGSVQNILADYPQFPSQLIEFRLISWMEMDYVPENYSPKQLDQFDRLTERWVDELDKQFPQSAAP